MNVSTADVAKLGPFLSKMQGQYATDRALLELQWLKNLRQYAGTYDPEVEREIPDERSHVYPRDTRIKVKGGVAKVMEMMFPAHDRNWSLAVTPNPSIPESQLQRIIDELQDQAQNGVIPSDLIEREVRKFAEARKEKMEAEIADQLADLGVVDYPQICKKVVRSGYIYGAGIARSPMVRTQDERQWEMQPDGTYVAVTKKIKRPYLEFCRIWDCYPDLSAKNWEDQEGFFERFVFNRRDFKALIKRKYFEKETIKEYLRTHPDGNYAANSYEADLQSLAKTSNMANRASRRYEVYRFLGFVSAHILAAQGVQIKEDEMFEDIFADVWIIDDAIIKARKASFGERVSDQYHAFIYTEDEDSGLTGMGLPEEIRDSSMSLCAATRALMDNMAAVAGPIFEVNTSLLPKGRKTIGAIHSFKTIEREGDGPEAQYPAVRAITTQSHIPEILNIIQMQRQQLDIESNLPAYTMGSMQQPLGEAFRTSNNMSMMLGSANMVTKDTVRAYDKFTTSVITSLLKWNMEFNPREEIKGDYQVQAKGNLSLVAKEVRGAALDQFVMTLSPEERAILDTYALLIDRLKARDLPTDRVVPKEEATQILESMRAAASEAAKIEQGLTTAKTENLTASADKTKVDTQVTVATADAVIAELMARVQEKLATAKSKSDKTQLENLSILLQTVKQKGGTNGPGTRTGNSK